ncbi:MAG: flagellar biosynthetic protein FliR [Hydrogenothermaceae bacterium]|nr:flagellar biosynthetic protein FliR [Hydrogenothermaceae bacterium]
MNPIITPDQAVAISLVFSRIIAFFMAFPILTANLIPLNVRILLVVSFSFIAMLHYDIAISVREIDLIVFTLLILKEMFIGFSMGIVVLIFLSIFMYAAEVISYFMGLTVVNIFNPAFGQTSILSTFFLLLFYLLFFITGAYQVVIGSLYKSFEIIPIDKIGYNDAILPYIISKSADIFKLGFQISFPFMLVLIVFNVVLALINRLIPQINVFFIGLPAQILIGFLALVFGSVVIVNIGVNLSDKMVGSILEVIKILSR